MAGLAIAVSVVCTEWTRFKTIGNPALTGWDLLCSRPISLMAAMETQAKFENCLSSVSME
jgi:hypothetical protein